MKYNNNNKSIHIHTNKHTHTNTNSTDYYSIGFWIRMLTPIWRIQKRLEMAMQLQQQQKRQNETKSNERDSKIQSHHTQIEKYYHGSLTADWCVCLFICLSMLIGFFLILSVFFPNGKIVRPHYEGLFIEAIAAWLEFFFSWYNLFSTRRFMPSFTHITLAETSERMVAWNDEIEWEEKIK